MGADHCTVSEMRQRSEFVTEETQYFKITTRLAGVQTRRQGEQIPLHYQACQEMRETQYGKLTCNKRVDASGYCASCNMTGKTANRLNVRTRFADFGDSVWLTTFHEAAEKVLGMPGDKLAEMDQGAEGRENLEDTLKQQYFIDPVEITCRAKLDMYNGEARTNVTCVGAAPVNRRDRGRKMLSEITSMLASL